MFFISFVNWEIRYETKSKYVICICISWKILFHLSCIHAYIHLRSQLRKMNYRHNKDVLRSDIESYHFKIIVKLSLSCFILCASIFCSSFAQHNIHIRLLWVNYNFSCFSIHFFSLFFFVVKKKDRNTVERWNIIIISLKHERFREKN